MEKQFITKIELESIKNKIRREINEPLVDYYNKIIEIDNSDLSVYDYEAKDLEGWMNRDPFWLSEKEKKFIDDIYDAYVL